VECANGDTSRLTLLFRSIFRIRGGRPSWYIGIRVFVRRREHFCWSDRSAIAGSSKLVHALSYLRKELLHSSVGTYFLTYFVHLLQPFIATMTESELHAIMTGGMATIAGSVFGIYVSFGT
jgi:hypothetical protein